MQVFPARHVPPWGPVPILSRSGCGGGGQRRTDDEWTRPTAASRRPSLQHRCRVRCDRNATPRPRYRPDWPRRRQGTDAEAPPSFSYWHLRLRPAHLLGLLCAAGRVRLECLCQACQARHLLPWPPDGPVGRAHRGERCALRRGPRKPQRAFAEECCPR